MSVLELLDVNRTELRQQYHVRKIGIFGSESRNEASLSSDVDILVEFDSPVDFFEFIDLKEHLERLLNRRVDLVTTNALKPQLRDRIMQETVYV
jgi:uncharacterized protein